MHVRQFFLLVSVFTVALLPIFCLSGDINTVVGNGLTYFVGNVSAKFAQLSLPYGVTSFNNSIYITDSGHSLIRMVSPNGQISILAGIPGYSGYNGDGLFGNNSLLNNPTGIAVSSNGSVYFSDTGNNAIRMISTSGVKSTVAGIANVNSGTYGGDGGPAIYAVLNGPRGLAIANNGEIYIADTGNNVIRMIHPNNNTITTIAGTCYQSYCLSGYSGDGGPATSAFLRTPSAVAVDMYNNIYIADTGNNVIRMIYPNNNTITTIAGTCYQSYCPGGYSGDGGPATSALLNFPTSVQVASNGSIYISDSGNNAIRMVSPSGIIYTLAGSCSDFCVYGYSGDGGLATNAKLFSPSGIWFRNNDGSLLIADTNNNVIRSVSSTNIITTTVGNHMTVSYLGVMPSALSASLNVPYSVFLANGSIYITENNGNTIKMMASNGSVITIAGNGTAGYSGDGGLASSAQVSGPTDIKVTQNGNIYFADSGNNLVRVIYPNGTINTIAGYCLQTSSQSSCLGGYTEDGVQATTTLLNNPKGISVQSNGDIYIADSQNNKIRKVAANGIIITVAGTLLSGYSGDGGPAYLAQLNNPTSVSVSPDGTIYFADSGNNVIRMITTNGLINTVAGDPFCSRSQCPNSSGSAIGVCLSSPTGVVALGNGVFYFSDYGNNLIRQVSNGYITTVAGHCQCEENNDPFYRFSYCVAGYLGDNGPATNALLNIPAGIYYAGNNLLYFADSGNNVIRKFISGGTLSASWSPLLMLVMFVLVLLL
jgi:sugar lactone lactonase YvrE